MDNNRSYILRAFVETPWAILPAKLAELQEIVMRHVSGEKLDAEEVQARIHGAARPPERRVDNVAVLPLFGTIFPRANMMTEYSGGTSAEHFGAQLSRLLDDPTIDAIVLDVESPGGQVGGIGELSKKIFEARGRKPIVAVANHFMASAAYWIASAADELVVSPSGEVGSIGVFAVHQDISEALAQAGVKMSIIKEGKYKAEANPFQPLSDEARDAIQERVSEIYNTFVESVARNRGVEPAAVRNGFGEGRMVGAYQAVSLGMADRVGTLAETIERLFGRNASPASSNASDTNKPEIAGQEPDAVHVHTQEARARLASVVTRSLEGENNMFLRELLNNRAALVARATALVEAADNESRDLTEEERQEFEGIMGVGEDWGQVGALDAQITRIQDEREKLRAAAEKKFGAVPEAQKPDAQNANVMKRADYEKLNPAAKAAFAKNGGKIED